VTGAACVLLASARVLHAAQRRRSSRWHHKPGRVDSDWVIAARGNASAPGRRLASRFSTEGFLAFSDCGHPRSALSPRSRRPRLLRVLRRSLSAAAIARICGRYLALRIRNSPLV